MIDATVSRLLEVVGRELAADDVRIEVGGRPPSGPRVLHSELDTGWRLVVSFDAEPTDRESLQARLDILARSFADIGRPELPERREGGPSRATAARRLDEELHLLAVRTGAVRAVVIDDRSPMVWGSSEPRRAHEDVDAALATAAAVAEAEQAGIPLAHWIDADPEDFGAELRNKCHDPEVATRLDRAVQELRDGSRRRGNVAWSHHLLAMQAVAAVRGALDVDPASRTAHLRLVERGEGLGYFSRGFASIYMIILVFDGRFSELHAEAGLLQGLPLIERLVLALPSTDPPPAGQNVIRLPR